MRYWLSSLAVLTVVASGLAVTGSGLPLLRTAAAAAPPAACLSEAADLAAAAEMARRCHRRVEMTSRRTETVLEFVNPDGTGMVEIAATPQRARRKDGTWSKLDATLRANSDGSLSPVASTVDVQFSGGGSGPLVTGDGYHIAMSVGQKLSLPRPVTEGAVATYPEVLPGVDLVMTALPTGFSEVLVVKNREAASNPALRAIRFDATGVRWETLPDGGLRALDAAGKEVLAAPAPLVWDSTSPSSRSVRLAADDWSLVDGPERSSVLQPGKAARRAPIGVSAKGGALTLTPSLLDDPGLEFPVYVDPTLNQGAWTMINSQFPNQSYWSFDKTDCPNGYPSGTNCAKVGRAVGYTMIYRSLFQFNTSSLSGKMILPGAVFAIDLLHSATCGTANWTLLMRIHAQIGSGTNWNNNSGYWPATSSATASHQSEACNSSRRYSEFASAGLQSELQAIADNGWTWATWGLRAEVESNDDDWKKYDAGTARVVVPVNLKPSMPDQLTVDNKSCVAGANRPAIKTVTPTLRAHVTDGDGDTMRAFFAYARWTPRDIPVRGDFTGDGKDDVAFWRPSDGNWNIKPSDGSANQVRQWGLDGDIPVTGDFNADGKTDALVWRQSTGDWYLSTTGGSSAFLRQWGLNGDVPLSGDFNGDNKDDTVIWRPSDVKWYIWLTGGSAMTAFGWGEAGDIPLTGDINGDNKDDAIIWRPSTGDWWVRHTDGSALNFRKHGAKGDVPLVGDFNNDGKDDLAYYRPSDHTFSVVYTNGGVDAPRANKGDKQVAGDYNGDGKADLMSWTGETGSWSVAYTGGSTSVLATGYGSNASSWVDVGGGFQGSVPHNTFGQLTAMPLADGGIYTFRSQTDDQPSHTTGGYGISPVTHMPGNCEFLIDVTNPAVPVVTPDIYLEGTDVCSGGPCGSVGKTGRFIFASSSDVTQFRYSWLGQPAQTIDPPAMGGTVTLDWTPTSGGPKTLNVTAIDRAGNEATKVYQFVVKAESPAIASWKLDDAAGSPQVADGSGNNRPGTVNGATLGEPGRVLGGETVMIFDGVNDYVTPGTAVIADSRKSFSVSAWVRLDDTASHEVLSQGGNTTSAFILESHSAGVWKFTSTLDDDPATAETYPAAVSASPPRAGVWTHLIGVYDSAAKELRLYVNGQLEGVRTGVTTWDANGPTRIGGYTAAPLKGALADVRIWDRVVFPREIADMSAAVNVGKYRFDYGYDPSVDESGFFHDLDYYGGASIDQTGFLILDGDDDNMATVDQVVHTDQSFTVSARVRLASTTGHDIIVSQDSDGDQAGFFLYYQNSNGGEWVFGIRDSKTTDVGTYATAPAVSLASWHQVAGVFDAQKRQIQLFVDGVLKSTLAMNATWQPWKAFGPLQIGRGLNGGPGVYGSYFHGDIDDVYVYQGIGPVGGPLGQWRLNDAAGSATVTDGSGFQQKATVYGATLGVPGKYGTAAQFDGVDDYLGGPSVLDTSKSFSVAAWVKLDTKGTTDRTIVSQMGINRHAFYLQFDVETGRWRAEIPSSDGASPVWRSADSTSVPQTGVWTHLAATYDAQAGELRLYVNGGLEATATGVVSFPASGELRIGRAFDFWHGAIDEVHVWNRVISPSEILNLQ